MSLKNNLSLIFGIAIPIFMIIFVAASIYLPQLFVKPQHNFLYVVGNNTCYGLGGAKQVYAVQNGKLVQNLSGQDLENCQKGQVPQLKIYMYDVSANQSREIFFLDAQTYNLDNSAISPDGFEIVRGSYGGGIFSYIRDDYDSRYIQGHNVSKKLNIQPRNYYNFLLLGWIIK